jgi:hypothetical protein
MALAGALEWSCRLPFAAAGRMRGLLGSYTPRTHLSPSRGGEEEVPELRRRSDGARRSPPDDVHKARAFGADGGAEGPGSGGLDDKTEAGANKPETKPGDEKNGELIR